MTGPSGRTDHFRPLVAGAEAFAGYPAADRERLVGARLVVGPSGQVWCLSGRFPELVGSIDTTGARVEPLPCALTPDQRTRLAGYTRAELRPLPLPMALYLQGPRPPASQPVRQPKPPKLPKPAIERAPSEAKVRRDAELARRRAAGEHLPALAAEFGLTPSGVYYAVKAHHQRQQRPTEAVA